ncbi:MAG: sulfatase-like hydrolase/transferase [Spirochaetia bacterium]|nr:sulfatase-like hydrolase/transferase [Spirochaetia bacterium]
MSVQEKPNILFILSDDQGLWATGCYGNHEIRTPNIDRLASSGVKFNNFFCTSPVCSPARASLLTGKIPSQHGVHDWIRDGNMPPDAFKYLDNITCYTDILSNNGYVCGLSGKWHLGDSMIPQHGFSHWFCHQSGGGVYNDAPMIRNGEPVKASGYITDVITDDAIAFIEENMDRPFYVSVNYTAPHSPWTCHPQEIVDSYDECSFESCPQEALHPWAGPLTYRSYGNRELLKGYFAAVTAMDNNIGRILSKLDNLGLRENTMIIFSSDNGFSCGHHGFWGKGNGTFPINMYDNSIKVPFIISHPGRISPDTTVDGLVSQYDFFPFLLDYLGLPKITDSGFPGKSFLSQLTDSSDKGNDTVVVYDEYGPVRMIRTKEWKYIHRYPFGNNELYNVKDDPDERINVIDDISGRAVVEELRSSLAQWFSRYVDPDKDGSRFPVTGSGQRRNIGTYFGEECFYNDRIVSTETGFPSVRDWENAEDMDKLISDK